MAGRNGLFVYEMNDQHLQNAARYLLLFPIKEFLRLQDLWRTLLEELDDRGFRASDLRFSEAKDLSDRDAELLARKQSARSVHCRKREPMVCRDSYGTESPRDSQQYATSTVDGEREGWCGMYPRTTKNSGWKESWLGADSGMNHGSRPSRTGYREDPLNDDHPDGPGFGDFGDYCGD